MSPAIDARPRVSARSLVRRLRRSPIRRHDPTATGGVWRSMVADFRRRWTAIERVIQTTVVDNDALRLADEPPGLIAAQAVPAGRFEFRTDPAGKADDFVRWLQEQMDAEVLEIRRGPGRSIVSDRRWMDTYIRSGYGRGVEHANYFLEQAGLEIPEEILANTFRRQVHAEAVGLLYTRAFTDLQGITETTGTAISRVLSRGLVEGRNPRDIAREMRQQVRGIGVRRSVVLSRTEIVRAHAEATLNRYEEAGAAGVVGMAEFQSAGDERVCPDCQELEGAEFTMQDARGVIPVHPQCRCVWIPVVNEQREAA